MLVEIIASLVLHFSDDAVASEAFSVAEADYKFPATIDADVLDDRETELWARVYWPDVAGAVAPGKHPLVVFLHGNHGTCGYGENPRHDSSTQYTNYGTCPDGYVVTPNHRGYDHIARDLVADGFVVVSINANRGITGGGGTEDDSGLNMARGRLVLRHLETLSQWNRHGGSAAAIGVDLSGHLDFSRVGLMGHSRGGEGVLAAKTFFADPATLWSQRIEPMRLRGVFELAPVDGQTSRQFEADGVPWAVLLPRCDGDVSDLQGIHVFDRAFLRHDEAVRQPKSTFYVFGANHNFFNTQWQVSDAYYDCDGEPMLWEADAIGSPAQMQIGTEVVGAFMRRYVAGDENPVLRAVLDPNFAMPASLAGLTSYERDYIESSDDWATQRLVDTDEDRILTQVTAVGAQVQAEPSDSPSRSGRQVLLITPTTSHDATVRMLVNGGAGIDLAPFKTLDMSMRATDAVPDATLVLTTADGKRSPAVSLRPYLRMVAGLSTALTSVRIPLEAFGALGKPVTAVEWTIGATSKSFELSTMRASRVPVHADLNAGLDSVSAAPAEFVRRREKEPRRLTGAIVSRGETSLKKWKREITVVCDDGFPARAELPRLLVGTREFVVSRYATMDQKSLTFTVPADVPLKRGERTEVRYGAKHPTLIVELGAW